MIHGDFPKNNNGSGLYAIYVVYYDQIDIKTTKNNFWDIVLVCRIERVNKLMPGNSKKDEDS